MEKKELFDLLCDLREKLNVIADARVALQEVRSQIRWTKGRLTLCDEYLKRGDHPPYRTGDLEKELDRQTSERDRQEQFVHGLEGRANSTFESILAALELPYQTHTL